MAKLLEKTIVLLAREVTILPELKDCNLSRTPDELKNLKDQIIAEGRIREPITVWPRDGQMVAVDGISRREIALEINYERPLVANQMIFDDMDEAKYWIRINQDSRRNLADHQQAYFIGQLYNELKNNPGALRSYLKAKGRLDLIGQGDSSEVHTAQLLGGIYGGLNEKTVRRNGQYTEGIDLIRRLNATLADQILHDTVTDDGRPVKVKRALIVKFLELEKHPKTIESIFDIQEALDQALSKEEDQFNEEKDSVIRTIQKFMKRPTEAMKLDVIKRIEEFFSLHRMEDKKQVKKSLIS